MIKRPLTKTIAISGLFLMAGAAIAGDKMEDRFKEADANKDGVIAYEEMMAKVREKFAEFDKNGDGFLELAELPKEMPIPDHMQERFEKRKEKAAEHMEKRAERRGEEFDAEEFAERMEARGKPTRLKFVAHLDRDDDERVSLEEFAEKPIHMFKRMDLNGDGKVTKDEANEARKHHFGKREGHGQRRP